MVISVAAELHAVMDEVRERTFRLVSHLDQEQLTTVLSPIMSPLSWDLGHVAAYEDLWLNHRLAGRELLRDDLAALYDAFETPRQVRGDLEFLRGAELHEYMAAVRQRALEAPIADGDLHELVIRHELQHTETMLQAMTIAGITPPSFAGPARGLRLRAGDGRGRRRARSSRARARRASPTTTSARATRRRPPASRSAARRSPTRPGSRSPRTADTSGASGGPTRAGRGANARASTATRAAGRARTRPSSTSPGARPTPSPAPTTRGCRPRPSGRRRRRVSSRGSGRSGSGRRATSPATRVSSRTRTGSIRKCSSATATACFAAAPVPRTRVSPPSSSATGTCPNAGNSLPESGSRDEDGAR